MGERTPSYGPQKLGGARKTKAAPPHPPVPPAAENTPSNGWDLLDDYQLGRDASNGDKERLVRAEKPASDEPAKPAVRGPSTASWAPSLYADNDIRIDPNWKPPAAESRPAKGTARVGRSDPGNDAALMAKINGRIQEHQREADEAIARAAKKKRQDEANMEAARERQQKDVLEYLEEQMRRDRALSERFQGSLEAALADAANVFLALGVCGDHVEYYASARGYVDWHGNVYSAQELLSKKNPDGSPKYVAFDAPKFGRLVFFSSTEIKWGLHAPLDPRTQFECVDRVLKVVRVHEKEGTARYSATKEHRVMMRDGIMTVYVAGPRVFFAPQLEVAYRAHEERRKIGNRVTDHAGRLQDGVRGVRDAVSETVSEAAGAFRECVVSPVVGPAADLVSAGAQKVKDALGGVTRFFKKGKGPTDPS